MLSPKVLKEIEEYPEAFYSFEDGLELEVEDIRQMLREVAEDLKKNPYAYSACGNAIIIGFRSEGEKNDSTYEYEFIVAKNYRTTTVDSLNIFEATDAENINAPKDFFDI